MKSLARENNTNCEMSVGNSHARTFSREAGYRQPAKQLQTNFLAASQEKSTRVKIS